MIHWSIWMIGVLGFLSVRAVICLRFYNKKTTLNARNISKKSKTTFIVFGSGMCNKLRKMHYLVIFELLNRIPIHEWDDSSILFAE